MNQNNLKDGKEEPQKYDLGKRLKTQGRLMLAMSIFLMECGEDY